MKKISLYIWAIMFVSALAFQTATAQFPIKIPKINKPKVEQPKPDPVNPTVPNDAKPNENRPAQKSPAQTAYLDNPEATSVPQFLLETLEIKAHNEQRYYKAPTQNDYSCWFPQVEFDVLYAAGSPKLRFMAEWFNPDGSLWFSEPLEMNTSDTFPHLRSPYESKDLDPRAVVAVGTYGLKITDTKTNQTVFQGKFKVNKMPLDPKLKNKLLFYVDNDWMLPIGYVGFLKNWTDYDVHTRPMVFFWFKGTPDESQFEGELYYNNQRIFTTDKGGKIHEQAIRADQECYLARDVCSYRLIGFEWENFVVDNNASARQNNPNGYFTKDKPGEYTVKVFYKGDQVRETKFTVDQKGWIARNAFSEQIFLNDHRVIVPVKIIGTMEKWNQATWKTDAFYGNPLKGFNAP